MNVLVIIKIHWLEMYRVFSWFITVAIYLCNKDLQQTGIHTQRLMGEYSVILYRNRINNWWDYKEDRQLVSVWNRKKQNKEFWKLLAASFWLETSIELQL